MKTLTNSIRITRGTVAVCGGIGYDGIVEGGFFAGERDTEGGGVGVER